MRIDRGVRLPASIYLLAFSSGVIGHRFLDALIPLWATLVALLFCALVAYWKNAARWVFVFALGVAWTNFTATNLLHTTIDGALEKQDVVVSGKIVGVPVQTPRYSRFDFVVDTLTWQGKAYDSPGKIRLKAYHNADVFKANQAWRFTVRLKQARGYQNPGSRFNYETYLFEHRIRATGYVRNEASNRLLNPSLNKYSISKFRERISTFIQIHMRDAPRHGILTALIVGVRGAMSDADWRILQNTGTIHLVAISGLHIGLVSGLVMWVAARVWRLTGQLQTRIPAQNVAVISGLVAGCCYALLAGMTIPTRRAVVMLSVVAISMLLKRKPVPFELLILALSVVLLVDPLTPLATGFWLSFCAVAVIICCVTKLNQNTCHENTRHINTRPGNKYSLPEKTKGWLSIQLGLSFGMAPLLLLLFHQLSLIAPLANLVAIPVIGFVAVPAALFGLCLFALGFPELALVVFEYVLIAIDHVWSVLQFLAAANWSVWQPPSAPIWALMLAAVGAALLFFRPPFPARFTAVLWFLPLLFFQPEKLGHGAFKYTMLEVGHGLASVVETQNHTLVYDTGPKFNGGMDAGKTVVVPYLKSRGIRNIDKLIISHEHSDHAGGYRAIDSVFNIDHFLAGVPDKIDGAPLLAEKCLGGQKWLWDGVRFEILWPLNHDFAKGNNASCVLKISSRFGSLLLTGDIEGPAERMMVARHGERLAADILQVPHQGSKTSSTTTFLSRVKPKLALLSSGYLNQFGHPHQVISERYALRQIPLIDTAHSGALTINFDHTQQQLNHRPNYRDGLNGYWFEPKGATNNTL